MINVIGRVISAVLGAVLAYFLKDPFLALIILIPVILLVEFFGKRIAKKKIN